MRCVFGLAVPDRGEVRWKGQPVDRDMRLRFGYMPEQRGLYPRMRVAEQLSYFAQQHGMSGKAANAAAGAWLERMGLADRAKSKLEELSHGNQQRVQLATALVHDPELLVLDEPFSGLDPIGIATMTDVVREQAAAGAGVVFSSHQLDLVEDVCEDVVIIARGRIVAAGAIDELKAASGRQHLEVEVAGSKGDWLDGHDRLQVLERTGDKVKLLVDRDVDLDGLLARARAAGEVRTFSYEPPEAVRAVHGSGHARTGGRRPGRWRDAPLAKHLAGRQARDPRTRPEPRLHPQRGVHHAHRGRLVRDPGDRVRRRQPDEGRHRRAVAARPPGRHRAVGAALRPQGRDHDLPRCGGRRRGPRRRRAPRSSSTCRPTCPAPARSGSSGSRTRRPPRSSPRRPSRCASRPSSARATSTRRRSPTRSGRPRPTSLQAQTEQDQAKFLVANIGAVLILVGIFSFGFTVLTGVVEEKQSRVVEVVLSTVRAA